MQVAAAAALLAGLQQAEVHVCGGFSEFCWGALFAVQCVQV